MITDHPDDPEFEKVREEVEGLKADFEVGLSTVWVFLMQLADKLAVGAFETEERTGTRQVELEWAATDVREKADWVYTLGKSISPSIDWLIARKNLFLWRDRLPFNSGFRLTDRFAQQYDEHYRRCKWMSAVEKALGESYDAFCRTQLLKTEAGEWVPWKPGKGKEQKALHRHQKCPRCDGKGEIKVQMELKPPSRNTIAKWLETGQLSARERGEVVEILRKRLPKEDQYLINILETELKVKPTDETSAPDANEPGSDEHATRVAQQSKGRSKGGRSGRSS